MGISPGRYTVVGCCFLLQGIFPTQGSNSGLLHCRQMLSRLNHLFFPPNLSEQILNAVVRAQVETSFVMSSEIQQMYQDRQSQFFFLIPHHSGKPRVLGRQCPEVLRDVCHALHGKINICFLRSYHLLKHQPLVSSCHPGNPALLHPGALPLGCWRWGLRFEVCRAQVFSGL